MNGLDGKHVLVTGGSSGIGRVTAQRLLIEGAQVHICGHVPEEVRRTIDELGAFGEITGEVADLAEEPAARNVVQLAAAEMGGLDGLVNNAGIAWKDPSLEIASERWDRIMDVNLRGAFVVAQETARMFKESGRPGSIVNMSSTNGVRAEVDYLHYNASKAGLISITQTLAVELGQFGIRVNALCPGSITTPIAATNQPVDRPDDDPLANLARPRIPLGRHGQATEVAAACAFLLSDEASYITGAILAVDGGQLAVM